MQGSSEGWRRSIASTAKRTRTRKRLSFKRCSPRRAMTFSVIMHRALLEACRWPELAEPHARALRRAVEFVLAETVPFGIIATGTIIRGEAHPASDIDLYVLHDAPYRRRVQRFFNGVPTEIFINLPHLVRSYFRSDHLSGRRPTPHMLSSGFVVLNRDPVIQQLRAESRDWLARPDALS